MVAISNLADLNLVLAAEQAFLVLWAPQYDASEKLIRDVMALAQTLPGLMIAHANVDAFNEVLQVFPSPSIPAVVLIKDGAHHRTVVAPLAMTDFKVLADELLA